MHAPVAGSKPVPIVGTAYRPDIDGLRAVAVISVVAFHAFPHSLRGGFIGVDIFFVISGFLITSIIIADLANGSFRLRNVLRSSGQAHFSRAHCGALCNALARMHFSYTDEYKELGKQVAASAGFAANLLFGRSRTISTWPQKRSPCFTCGRLGSKSSITYFGQRSCGCVGDEEARSAVPYWPAAHRIIHAEHQSDRSRPGGGLLLAPDTRMGAVRGRSAGNRIVSTHQVALRLCS